MDISAVPNLVSVLTNSSSTLLLLLLSSVSQLQSYTIPYLSSFNPSLPFSSSYRYPFLNVSSSTTFFHGLRLFQFQSKKNCSPSLKVRTIFLSFLSNRIAGTLNLPSRIIKHPPTVARGIQASINCGQGQQGLPNQSQEIPEPELNQM